MLSNYSRFSKLGFGSNYDSDVYAPMKYFLQFVPQQVEKSILEYEQDNETVLTVDVPGVSKSNVTVSVENDVLYIDTRRPGFKETDAVTSRSFMYTFPPSGDKNGMAATVVDGVLTVRIPKLSPVSNKILVDVK